MSGTSPVAPNTVIRNTTSVWEGMDKGSSVEVGVGDGSGGGGGGG